MGGNLQHILVKPLSLEGRGRAQHSARGRMAGMEADFEVKGQRYGIAVMVGSTGGSGEGGQEERESGKGEGSDSYCM